MPYASATKVMPMNRMARRAAIATSVWAAFRGSGGLNAGTPLAIASVPVNATEPPANARSSSRMVTASSGSGAPGRGEGGGAPSPMTTIRNVPIAIMIRAEKTNRYVGTAKMLPDSRSPRRLPTVISKMATTAITTV
jgi:hypothetical protein